MRLEGTPNSRRSAKRLRRELTPPEIALWLALRNNDADLRFCKQYPAGDYILDFYCAPARLAIEVDGEAHERGDHPARDAKRDHWLTAREVRVVRYPAKQVLNNLDGVLRQIIAIALARRNTIEAHRRPPPPSPSAPPPPGGGG
jgi:very-short-patch-repair endonuclease